VPPYSRRPRVLVVCAERISDRLTGVAIRAIELARVLSAHAEVTVAGLTPSQISDLPVISYERFGDPRRSHLAAHINESDFIVAQPPWPLLAHAMRRSPARLIYDLYDPEPLEVIERLRASRRLLRRLSYMLTTDRVLDGLASADHLMCASEKQRDFWLGAMLAERLISTRAYDADPSLRSRLDTVPFGLPVSPPMSRGGGPRSVLPGIREDDELVLWNGGIWAWLDASAAIRAIALLRDRRRSVRLVFMGSSALPAARQAERDARQLADALGVLDREVFFNDTWVDYERRADWLLEASCVLSTQQDHLETRFAFRTRMLDALWARRPIVCTTGDDLAQLVAREDLGEVVPAGMPEALATAIERVLERGTSSYAQRLAAAAERFTWPTVAQPLVRWVVEGQPGAEARYHVCRRGRVAQRLRTATFEATLRVLNHLGVHSLPSI
jgi:glycosyltransferase involved in cell wall biosynthesis